MLKTHFLSISVSYNLSLTPPLLLPLSYSPSITPSHLLPLTYSLSLAPSHLLPLTYSLSLTSSHLLPLSYSLSLTPSLLLPPSLTLSVCHTHPKAISLTSILYPSLSLSLSAVYSNTAISLMHKCTKTQTVFTHTRHAFSPVPFCHPSFLSLSLSLSSSSSLLSSDCYRHEDSWDSVG